MRFFSSILFLLMALVLPMAGVQQYFCTIAMAYVDGPKDCPVEKKDCCNKQHKPKQDTPDCMLVAKLLPDANLTNPVDLPATQSMDIGPEFQLAEELPALRITEIIPQSHRGPPDFSRTYFLQCRLLI